MTFLQKTVKKTYSLLRKLPFENHILQLFTAWSLLMLFSRSFHLLSFSFFFTKCVINGLKTQGKIKEQEIINFILPAGKGSGGT